MSNYHTDHAPYSIATAQKLKGMHSALLKGDYDKAVAEGTQALVELRLAVLAVKDLRDQQKMRE